eukprot:2383548-Amphidinium_carterae.1
MSALLGICVLRLALCIPPIIHHDDILVSAIAREAARGRVDLKTQLADAGRNIMSRLQKTRTVRRAIVPPTMSAFWSGSFKDRHACKALVCTSVSFTRAAAQMFGHM